MYNETQMNIVKCVEKILQIFLKCWILIYFEFNCPNKIYIDCIAILTNWDF